MTTEMKQTAVSQRTAEMKTADYVYEATGNWLDWRSKRQELIAYRYLLRNLVVRDIKARYKDSILGILWSLLNPLGLMLVFTVVFSVLSDTANSPRAYPVFVLVGIIPWTFFSGSLSAGANTIIGNASLVKKVYFPRELLPVSTVLSNFVNFLFAFAVLIVFLYVYDIGLTIHALWVPILMITQVIFIIGLTFILCALAVLYRDVIQILGVMLQAWFFLTPVFYSLDIFGPRNAQIMRWVNPMASIIDGYRTVLWGTTGSSGPASMNPEFLLRTFVTSFIVMVLGYLMFLRIEHVFGERL